jgi:hypothetical protein
MLYGANILQFLVLDNGSFGPTNTSQGDDDNPGQPADAQRRHQIEDCFGQMNNSPDCRQKAKVEPLPNSG